MNRKFLICELCGNLMELIQDSGVTPNCCGSSMKVLKPNSSDGAGEKHVPVIKQEGNHVTVYVGEIPHPMTEEHYIEWIYLETTKGIKRMNLTPNDEPKAEFALLEDEEVKSAYAYCNLHSLWIKEN